MVQGSLEHAGDETLEQAKAVINLLATAKRYRSGPNSVGVGKTIVAICRRAIPTIFVSLAISVVIEWRMGKSLTRQMHPGWFWTTEIISGLGLAASGILILSSGWLLWRHRSGLVENDAHHLRSGYLLHEEQVRELATFSLAILQSVSRYFEKRPAANRGIHLAFSGKGNVSLATVAIGLTMVKQLYDLHAFGLSASDGDVVFFVWLSLLTLLYIGVMVGWFGRREDYQRALLADAIAVVTDLSGKPER